MQREIIMITYTFEDIDVLAQIYQNTIPKLNMEAYNLDTSHINAFNYHNQIKEIIKEKKTPSATLMEFLGAYESAVNDPASKEFLHKFLFEEPLDEMPLFISSKGEKTWKDMVSIWRLKIGK